MSEWRQGAIVYDITKTLPLREGFIDKAAHLAHIHKAPQTTWPLLAEWLVTPNTKGKTPSANQTQDIVKQKDHN